MRNYESHWSGLIELYYKELIDIRVAIIIIYSKYKVHRPLISSFVELHSSKINLTS